MPAVATPTDETDLGEFSQFVPAPASTPPVDDSLGEFAQFVPSELSTEAHVGSHEDDLGEFAQFIPVTPTSEAEKALDETPKLDEPLPQGALGERPPMAETIAGWLDSFANIVTGGRSGPDTLTKLVKSSTYVPEQGEPSFTNAGIPTIPIQEGQGAQTAAGLANIPIGFANFLLSPGGVATMHSLGMAPKLVQTLVGAGFTADQAHNFINAKTTQEMVTSGVGAALLGLGTLAPVIKGRVAGAETSNIQRSTSNAEVEPQSLETKLPVTSEAPPDLIAAAEDKPGASVEAAATTLEPSGLEGGPGAASSAEFAPQRTTSTKNAITDMERLNQGLLPTMKEAVQTNPQTFSMAEEKINANPNYGQEVVDGLLSGRKRDVSEIDEAVLLHEKITTMNERDMAAERALDPLTSEEERADAHARFNELEGHLNNIDQATHRSGTIWGRLGQFRQRLMRDDYTFKAMERRARLEKGEPLTPEESATIKQQSAEIQTAATEAETAETARVEGEAGAQATEAVVSIKRKTPRVEAGADVGAEGQRIVEGIKTRVAEGDKPTDLRSLIQKLAENFVRKGITERDPLVDAVHGEVVKIVPDLTRRQTMDLISGYGDVKLLNSDAVKAQLRDIKGQLQQVGKIEDMMARQPPKKTGLERRTSSDEERRLIKQVNELKKKGGFVVTDPAKQLRSALDAIKTRLRNQISDLDHQIATRSRIVKTKTGVPLDVEAEGLRQQRDELKARFTQIFGKPEMTYAQRVQLARIAVERGIKEYERRIGSGDFSQKKGRTPVTPELEALRRQRDDLRNQYKLLESAAHPERALETALRVYRAGLERRTAELERRMVERDFAPKPKKAPLVLDKPTTDALFRAQKVKDQYNRQLFQWKLEQRSIPAKVGGAIRDTLNTARAIKTSIDLSAVFRQGAKIVFAHPIRGARSFMPMVRAFGSEKAHFKVFEEIKRRPNYPLYQSSKLYISDIHDTQLSKLEEVFMTRWADKVPLVAGSQRAYVTFLNKLRADSFDAMAKTLTRDGRAPTQMEARAITNYVNVASGRGEMGAHAVSAVTLNTAFFAPRYVLSRFQLLAGQPFYKGTAGTRMLIGREYARSLAGLGTVFALGAIAGGTIELDPSSSDFGKIRFGNTRVDPLAGLAQTVTLLARVASGTTKTSSGDIVSIRGEDVPYKGDTTADVIFRFVRSKLSPSTGTAVDISAGENIVGQPVTPASATASLIAPMNVQDVYQAMVAQGIPAGVALGLLATLGMGVNTYEQRNKKASNSERPTGVPVF